MPRYHFVASPKSISILFDGRMQTVPNTQPGFAQLYEHLKESDHDYATVNTLLNAKAVVERLNAGDVKVVGDTVFFRGQPVYSTLAERIVEQLNEGFDARPWALFMDKLMANPSSRARTQLYEYLERWNTPLTDNGDFVAFKRVRSDYTDVRTGTIDNSPGTEPWMPREEVEENPDVTCSRGLHVCSYHYLPHFPGACIVSVAVNPANVVSIPTDYQHAKMRVCRYKVIGDVSGENHVEYASKARVDDHGGEYVPEGDVTRYTHIGIDSAARPTTDRAGRRLAASWEELEEEYDVWGFDDEPYVGQDVVLAEADARAKGFYQTGVVTATMEVDHGLHAVDVLWQDGTVSKGLEVGMRDDDENDLMYIEPGTGIPVDERDFSEEGEDEDDVANEMCFERDGTVYPASTITAGIETHGQRGFSRLTGIPRTTLQDWVVKIEACA